MSFIKPRRFIKKRTHSLIAFTLVLLTACVARSEEKVTFSLKPEVVKAKAGEEAKVTLDMSIIKGWYTYGTVETLDEFGIGPQATTITVEPASVVKLARPIKASKTKKKFDEGFEIDIEIYPEEATFGIPVQVDSGLEPGTYPANVLVYYQICDSTRCLPPVEDTLAFTVEVTHAADHGAAVQSKSTQEDETGNAAVIEQTGDGQDSANAVVGNTEVQTPQDNDGAKAAVTTDSQRAIEEKRQEGAWVFLLAAMSAGAFALLTPCVFPMIPITVSFFTKRAESNKGSGLRDSIVYCLGIMMTFTAIGVVVSSIWGPSGVSNIATNPWINLLIAGIFIALALNLFGAFEIRIPSALLSKLDKASNEGSGMGAVLLMGLTFSLTSFTCTVPFVAAALGAASDGEWFYPILGMLGFSGVFALPFFLLALFPSYMTKLPKAGGWMNNIKVVMGFLEIAAALKFISNTDMVWTWGILSRETFLAIWIGCAFLITLYILGVFYFKLDSPVERIGAPRAMFALVFVSTGFFLISGMFGARLGELDAFIPPSNYYELMEGGSGESASATSSQSKKRNKRAHMDEEFWLSDYNEALTVAAESNKPVFIDFTGVTCTNCRWMETNIFPLPNVRSKMDDMVLVRLFTDRRSEKDQYNQRLQKERFGSIELPLYVILSPQGDVLGTKTFTRDRSEFEEFLDKGKI